MEGQLQEIGDILLQTPEDLGAVWKACGDYKSCLLKLSDLDLRGDQERSNIGLQQGMALGTTWAAYCLDDFVRTRRFIKGVHLATSQVLHHPPQRPVHLLYAGTGPFASLILPLTRYFSPDELQFTLLEINPLSFRNLEQLLSKLELEPYIRHLQLTDATQYRIPEEEKVDILLSETMQAGLRREAQVPIFHHLLNQPPAREAILIPERIELFLGAFSSAGLENPERRMIAKFGSYFRLDRQQLLDLPPEEVLQEFPAAAIRIPDDLNEAFDRMAILTEIDIFGDQKLEFNESGLTVPLMIRDLRRDPAGGLEVNIAYSLRNEPGEILHFKKETV